MAKLFGFKLNDTSGVLLFISMLGLLLAGFFGIALSIQSYQNTEHFPTMSFMFYLVLTGFALYVLSKVIKQRNR